MTDKKKPHKGVVVKMSRGGHSHDCSLSVSVFCDLKGVQVRTSSEILVTIDPSSFELFQAWGMRNPSIFCFAGSTFSGNIRDLRLCECFQEWNFLLFSHLVFSKWFAGLSTEWVWQFHTSYFVLYLISF